MLRKQTQRLIAFLCAAMLVWSQLAVAAYACPVELSFAAPAAAAMAGMPADCAGDMDMDAKPSPLCKAHCDPSAQADHRVSFDIPPLVLMSAAPAFLLDLAVPPAARAHPVRPSWLADASPPLRIQFQVFRI
jgi:hypothetical protein